MAQLDPRLLLHVNCACLRHLRPVSVLVGRHLRTVAKIALPELKKRRLRRHGGLGSLAGAGTLGILIPPRSPWCLWCRRTSSIIQFLAGFLPGLLVMALYSGYIALWSIAHPDRSPPADPSMPFRQKLRESAKLGPLMLLIALVFLSLLMGWATATECAAWGVLGSLGIAWWHGMLNWPAFWASVMGATRVNCMIMLILAGASYMSTSMGYTGIPNALAAWVGS